MRCICDKSAIVPDVAVFFWDSIPRTEKGRIANGFDGLPDGSIDICIPSALKVNELNPKYPENNPDLFWNENAITVSRIDRTKGNEADMVYVVGLDHIAKNESNPKLRNQLFVALTRSRGWVHLSGIGDYPFYEEVRKVMAQKDTFTFTIIRCYSPRRC